MRIAIFGSNGMLGRYVSSYLFFKGHSVANFTRKEFDILKSDFSTTMPNLNEFDLVVNCAGIVKSLSESKYSEAEVYKVNSIFPKILAAKSKKLIHISTDCVFPGTNIDNYENSASLQYNLDLYGRSKLLGEPIEYKNALTIRTSIIGEESRGDSLLEFVRKNKNKTINGYLNHYWNGVTCLQLAKFIEDCTESAFDLNSNNVSFPSNLIHYHSPEVISKYNLCGLILVVYGLEMDIEVVPYKTDTSCYRNLKSLYTISQNYCTKSILMQLDEQKEWGDKYFK